MDLVRADGLVWSDDPGRIDLETVRRFLADSYWAHYRSADTIARSLAHSRPYGVYTADGAQIALTRATTDLATFCWLGDVYVDPAWRGRGVGRWMVANVVTQLRAAGVPRFVLATLDAHGVYAALGFTPLADPRKWMELDARPVIP